MLALEEVQRPAASPTTPLPARPARPPRLPRPAPAGAHPRPQPQDPEHSGAVRLRQHGHARVEGRVRPGARSYWAAAGAPRQLRAGGQLASQLPAAAGELCAHAEASPWIAAPFLQAAVLHHARAGQHGEGAREGALPASALERGRGRRGASAQHGLWRWGRWGAALSCLALRPCPRHVQPDDNPKWIILDGEQAIYERAAAARGLLPALQGESGMPTTSASLVLPASAA